jgi:hypothetical protein
MVGLEAVAGFTFSTADPRIAREYANERSTVHGERSSAPEPDDEPHARRAGRRGDKSMRAAGGREGLQDFPIRPNPDDPDACNVYNELQIPDDVYESIREYQEKRQTS